MVTGFAHDRYKFIRSSGTKYPLSDGLTKPKK